LTTCRQRRDLLFQFRLQIFRRRVTDESLLAEDCSRFLPLQHKTLGRRLFKDVSVVRQDPLMTEFSVCSFYVVFILS